MAEKEPRTKNGFVTIYETTDPVKLDQLQCVEAPPLTFTLPRLSQTIEGGEVTGYAEDGTPIIEGSAVVFRDPKTGLETDRHGKPVEPPAS